MLACVQGDLQTVKALETRVNVNVCSALDGSKLKSPLSAACLMGHSNVVEWLLRNPLVDVNSCGSGGVPALYYSGLSQDKTVAKLLLEDPRTDVNTICHAKYTLFSWFVVKGNTDMVEMIISSGKKICWHPYGSPRSYPVSLEYEGRVGLITPEMVSLIWSFKEDPEKVRRGLRQKLRWYPSASDTLALIIFVADGYLKPKEPSSGDGAQRFFGIASRLHFDLQMVLANRVVGFKDDIVPSSSREAALKRLAAFH